MPSPVQSNCDAHDTIANGQYGAVRSMGHTQQVVSSVEIGHSFLKNDSADCENLVVTIGEPCVAVILLKKTPEGSELANMVANDAKMAANVANLVAENNANLAIPPRFRQVLIESPL
ncbi:hypothetical protein TNCV_2529991 [Trichonephila clavipes]|nr:hypothetical protein TNCV_2529991 [Trichonephila clavipes]